MKKMILKYFLTGIVTILFTGISSGFSQMRSELKDFLWDKDFDDLITNYAEEVISLRDAGDLQKRLEMRSFNESPGYRIQTFAGSNLDNARKMAEDLTALELDSVYIVEDEGLFKVQIGNFQERLESEKMLDQLRFKGITNAWIVETTIHVTKQTPTPPDTLAPRRGLPSIYFAIQLFVTKDPERANIFSTEFQRKVGEPAYIIQSGEYWKVLSGKFTQELLARQQLDAIRNGGYLDAWLTQISP